MQACTPPLPIRLVVLGLGVGVCGGAKETAPPVMVLSPSSRRQVLRACFKPDARLPSRFLQSAMVVSPSTRLVGVARESVPSSTLEFSLESCVVSVSMSLPPTPFPRTTVLVPLLSLLTGEDFRGRSALPCPAGPGRPAGCFDVSGPRPFPPPPPPSLFYCNRRWVC